MGESCGWSVDGRAEIASALPPDLGGRYRHIRLLKSGQGIDTHLAVDLDTGSEVVIKTTDATMVSAEARMRLEHEAAVLRRVESSFVAPLLEVGYESDVLYVVMPFVAGVTLQNRLADGALCIADALTLARCTLSALGEIHDQGVLHCDVKPANIVVDAVSPLGRATLVDFGLARSPSLAVPLRGRRVGTVQYMAPEQAGLLDRTVDGRADLYSLGVVLFEAVAGRPPFDAESLGEVLRQQLSTPPPPLRSLGIAVPRALEDIVGRLLRKDPDDRYQSARGALADVEALAVALERGFGDPPVAVGAHDRRATLTEPALTGREPELATLEAHLDDARRGAGRLVVVEADPGGGKSRLLDEFCQGAAASGAWVLRGQGVERTTPRPLQILAGVVADVLAAAESAPGAGAALRERLGEARVPLCEALPELRELLWVSQVEPPGPEAYGQARGVSALVRLLGALGSPERPAVIALDDCQWADELTLRVLVAWAGQSRAPHAPGRHVLVVAAVRPEELGDEHPWQRLDDGSRLALAPLAPELVRRVVESMAGPVPDEAADVVCQLSRGNPFMVSAVLRGLVEAGALASSPHGWRFDPGPARWQASREAACFLAQRLELLSSPTCRLLSAGAVLGREFDVPLAAALAGQDEDEAARAVAQAAERHLVWRSGGDHCRFVHDRIREALLGGLEGAEQARMHHRAAHEVETIDASRVFELAYHFDAGGEPERAAPYALRAGQEARSRHDLELAERQYRIAERGTAGADGASRRAVAEALGQILMLRGRYDEAGQRLEQARSLASDEVTSARLQGHLGELAFKCDDLDGAARRLQAALQTLGETVPRRGVFMAVLLGWELLLRALRRRISRSHRPVPAASPGDDERRRLTAHLYARLAYAWWFRRPSLATVWVLLRQVNAAERCPGSPELAHAHSIYGAGMAAAFPPLWRRGLRYTDDARALHEHLGDLWGQGQAWSTRAIVLHAAGRFRDSLEACDRAVPLLEQSGDPWELTFAVWHRALCSYRLGRFMEAAEHARQVHRAGIDVGNPQAEATGLEIWAKAVGGQLAADLVADALRHGGEDIHSTAAALQADALRLRASGSLSAAIAALEEAERMVRRSRAMNVYVAPVLPWLATLYREAAEQAPPLPLSRRRLARRARRAVRRALRYARVYRNDLPHALREAAMAAALSGRPRRARRRFDRSAAVAEDQGASAEWAETLRQRERLRIPPRRPTRRNRLTGGQGIVEAPEPGPAQATLGLAERFAVLLDAGGRLASAGSTEEIAAAVREAAVALLRAEQCVVVGFGADEEAGDGSEPRWAPGRALAERAVAQRRPVVLTEALTGGGDTTDSVTLAGIRSALCAPILVRDEVGGYFLALHSQVGGLFGEEEERLARFIAHLAGAALVRQRLQVETRAGAVAAQEAERARVARDLHDEIGQALTSVLLGVRLVETSFQNPTPEAGRLLPRIEELRHVTADALAEVQRLAFDLRPTVLDDLGLAAALNRLTSDVASRHGLAVELDTGDLGSGGRLPSDIETTVYRVVQEALTNVVRHSRASACSVVLTRRNGRLRVVVEDNGTGFDPDTRPPRGLGRLGMEERAALVGGTLRLTSTPGQGTDVVLEVPVG